MATIDGQCCRIVVYSGRIFSRASVLSVMHSSYRLNRQDGYPVAQTVDR